MFEALETRDADGFAFNDQNYLTDFIRRNGGEREDFVVKRDVSATTGRETFSIFAAIKDVAEEAAPVAEAVEPEPAVETAQEPGDDPAA